MDWLSILKSTRAHLKARSLQCEGGGRQCKKSELYLISRAITQPLLIPDDNLYILDILLDELEEELAQVDLPKCVSGSIHALMNW